jgi:hypothetical protein
MQGLQQVGDLFLTYREVTGPQQVGNLFLTWRVVLTRASPAGGQSVPNLEGGVGQGLPQQVGNLFLTWRVVLARGSPSRWAICS